MELLKKLNYKNQSEIIILNSPEEFNRFKDEISKIIPIHNSLGEKRIKFILIFVKTRAEVKKFADLIFPNMVDDGIVWFAFPKKTSKKYKSEISRDEGWESFEPYQYTIVRIISIDDDWSAARFRQEKFIKK